MKIELTFVDRKVRSTWAIEVGFYSLYKHISLRRNHHQISKITLTRSLSPHPKHPLFVAPESSSETSRNLDINAEMADLTIISMNSQLQ